MSYFVAKPETENNTVQMALYKIPLSGPLDKLFRMKTTHPLYNPDVNTIHHQAIQYIKSKYVRV